MEKSVIDVIQAVVDDMTTTRKLLYGSANEVVLKLSIMAKTAATNAKRYPLVALFTDIPERKGEMTGIQSTITIPTILFVHVTKKEYMAEQRKEKVFDLVLQPMYEQFMEALQRSTDVRVMDWRQVPHTKTDRFSWGKSAIFTENNAGTEFIDAIEIQNLQLSIYRKHC